MGKRTLNAVPCPVCKKPVEGVVVEESTILDAKRTPVIIAAKCPNGHPVVLFVDRNFTVRDIESAGEAIQEEQEESSVDKAKSWMDSF